jgi:hypothetical protein
MITAPPYTTAEILTAAVPPKVAGKGTVEKDLDNGVYLLSFSAGKVLVKAAAGSLSAGNAVTASWRGGEFIIQKTPEQPGEDTAPQAGDSVDRSRIDPPTLKAIVDTVVGQLRNRILDPQALERMQKILAAISQSPGTLDNDTRKAIADLKAVVASTPDKGADIESVASDITNKIIALGDRLARQLSSGGGAIDVVLRPQARPQEGYYQFDSVKEALEWIAKNKQVNEDIPWQKLSQMFGNGPVVLKVYDSAVGDVRASFVSPDKVGADIAHFTASSLAARVWNSLPQTTLVSILADTGHIPLDRLLQIDRLLSAYESVGADAPPGSTQSESGAAPASPGLAGAFAQWLSVALDKNVPAQAMVSRAPWPVSQQFGALLEAMEATVQNAGVSLDATTDPAAYALSKESVASSSSRENALADLFERLGLNLEASLLKAESLDGSAAKPQSLKAQLLSLAAALDSAAGQTPSSGAAAQTSQTQQGAAMAPQNTDAAASDALVRFARLLDDAAAHIEVIQQATGGVQTAAGEGFSGLSTPLPPTLAAIRQAATTLDALATSVGENVQSLSRDLSTAASQDVPQGAASPVAEGPQDQNIQMQDSPVRSAQTTLADGLEVAGQIRALARDILQGVDRLSTDVASRETSPARLQAAFEALAKNVAKGLDGLAAIVSERSQSARATALQQDLAARAPQHPGKTEQDAAASQRTALDTLRAQVEHVLTRVESLQVLAKQVSVADGVQQVISLPIKIDGQWTDVMVKFLKRKNSQAKDRSKKNVSVVIRVAPEVLGNIAVYMDYAGKQSLGLRMEFDKASSRQWFESNRADFSAALEKLGFLGPRIAMAQSRPEEASGTVSGPGGGADTTIDITA